MKVEIGPELLEEIAGLDKGLKERFYKSIEISIKR